MTTHAIAESEHRSLRRRLPAYVAGLLDEVEEQRIAAHLEACEPCRALIEDLKATEFPGERASGHLPAELVARWDRLAPLLRGIEREVAARHVSECDSCREELKMLGYEPVIPGATSAAPVDDEGTETISEPTPPGGKWKIPAWWYGAAGGALAAAAAVAIIVIQPQIPPPGGNPTVVVPGTEATPPGGPSTPGQVITPTPGPSRPTQSQGGPTTPAPLELLAMDASEAGTPFEIDGRVRGESTRTDPEFVRSEHEALTIPISAMLAYVSDLGDEVFVTIESSGQVIAQGRYLPERIKRDRVLVLPLREGTLPQGPAVLRVSVRDGASQQREVAEFPFVIR